MADFIKARAHLKAVSRHLLNAIDLADDLRRTLAQAEPVREPFALPCPTPKACKAHCCSGDCVPLQRPAEPVQQRNENLAQRLRAKGYEAEDSGSAVENIKESGNG